MQVEEQIEIRDLTEIELDAVDGGFLGRLLAPYKEMYLKFEMSDLVVSS